MGLVFLEVIYRLVIAGGKEYFRPGTFPVFLLGIVQGLFQEFLALGQHELVQFWQIVGVISHRVLHEQDYLDTDAEDIIFGISAVFDQFHDSEDQVCIPMPAEQEVYAPEVCRGKSFDDCLGIVNQQDERNVPAGILQVLRKREQSIILFVVHADDNVHLFVALDDISCLI